MWKKKIQKVSRDPGLASGQRPMLIIQLPKATEYNV